jgi:UDP-N-acetylglucosamine/UDP-N-acetylgalactosamine 4-epimerase
MKPFPALVDDLKGKHILVTGGAGFIGSNLVEALLKLGAKVRVLDDLSTGFQHNIEEFANMADFSFIKGDIRDYETCMEAMKGVDAVSHQAALGSVPRSIAFPLTTHDVNATGFLTMLHAAKESGIKRFVFASSSSVFGDSLASPKKEGQEGNMLSPYAVTKQLNEQYAGVYYRLHGMETIGLRYFNIFGPKQDPNGVYAAAIPKFLGKMQNGGEIIVNGDGNQTRDFTYVRNAVLANLLSLTGKKQSAYGKVYNVACGQSYTLNSVIDSLSNGLKAFGIQPQHVLSYGPKRAGDIQDSLADVGLIADELQYEPLYTFDEGIAEYLAYTNR